VSLKYGTLAVSHFVPWLQPTHLFTLLGVLSRQVMERAVAEIRFSELFFLSRWRSGEQVLLVTS